MSSNQRTKFTCALITSISSVANHINVVCNTSPERVSITARVKVPVFEVPSPSFVDQCTDMKIRPLSSRTARGTRSSSNSVGIVIIWNKRHVLEEDCKVKKRKGLENLPL